MKCDNICCKNCGDGGECLSEPAIGANGRCTAFERGFYGYIGLVFEALKSKNYIDAIEMNDDLRLGMFYVMSCYHIGFSEMKWGLCRMFLLQESEDSKSLNYEALRKLPFDEEAARRLKADFDAGIIPGRGDHHEKHHEPGEKSGLDFGWLSPAGDYTESPFGSHEESAYSICEERGWLKERYSWGDTPGASGLARDFLVEVKGYCLIHNPAGIGGYIVTSSKALTKRQREFLYEFFLDKGDRFKAEQYLEVD